MKLSILADNTSANFLTSEFGFSCYIESDDKTILFDTGFSNVFLDNASILGIDLNNLDYIFLSHGHEDHTWGLTNLIQYYMQKNELKQQIFKPTLICCPSALEAKWLSDGYQNGILLNKETLNSFFHPTPSKDPIWITENVVFLGEIERKFDFENEAYKENVPPGKTVIDGKIQEDQLLDDSAMACKTKEGLVIITGCSHSGICNIIEYAKKVCNENRIVDVIGGFHLLNTNEKRLTNICEFFKKLSPKNIHPCHCTDFNAKNALSEVVSVKEIGSGSILEY